MKAYTADIENAVKTNKDFRRVLFTGKQMQLVVMRILPGEEIGSEIHHDTDQFFYFEDGKAALELDDRVLDIREEMVVLVPAGVRHNIRNMSHDRDLRLFTLYAPPEHDPDTVQRTKAVAEPLIV